jgi:hypothetical protein
MVDAFIASLKVALTVVLIATPVALAAGEVLVTVGEVVSGKSMAFRKLSHWLSVLKTTLVIVREIIRRSFWVVDG